MDRRRPFLGGIVAVALLVAACGTSTSTSSPTSTNPATGATATPVQSVAPSAKRLTWAKWNTVDNAWALETDDAFILTTSGVGETLVRTGFDGKIEGALATDWQRTGDLTWEFTLRDGVKFQDGTPLDAQAVAAALNHLLTVEAPARSFNPKNIASVEAVGSNKVMVTSVVPNALLPLYLASPNTLILAPKAYTAGGIDPTQAGTGPFVITAQNLPEGMTLDRNPDYWGGEVALAGVDVRFVPDGSTRATLLQSGEAQIVDSVPIPSLPILASDPSVQVVRSQQARTNSLYLNNSRAPLDNVLVRQAIQSAVDVDAIANQVLEGAVAPASGPFAPTAAYAPAGATPIKVDVEKAKSLLSQAGYAEGALKLSLWTYPSRTELPDVAVAIQQMLAKAGIVTEVRVADYAALEGDVLAGNYDMFILSRGYLTDINDPAGFLTADYTCKGSYNLSHFCDPQVDKDLAAAVANDDTAARYSVYSAIASRLQADAVDVFLYNPQELKGVSTKVQNLKIHPLEQYLLTPELSLAD
jgi:peptide/nickel transport system substrate-binding protein